METPDQRPSFLSHFGQFTLEWAPRTIAAAAGGFYSLGVAYEYGWMAEIDKVAIRVFKARLGSVGMGAIMPTFQWYAAWGIRLTAGFATGILYDIILRICKFIYASIRRSKFMR